jgi:uncharacterized protein with FMN-binding domain
MKKFILSVSVTFVFLAYIVLERHNMAENQVVLPITGNSSTAPITDNQTVTTTSPAQQPKPASTSTTPKPTPTPAPKPTPAPVGQYKDGQYTGPSIDAYYGFVQVKAIISGGKMTEVQFLDYPQDRGTSRQINGQAMPYLIQEAISAQSANVNIISGATDTSNAFVQSLGAALAMAKN